MTSSLRKRGLRERLLPSRETYNLIAELGDRSAERTVVIVTDHNAPLGPPLSPGAAAARQTPRFHRALQHLTGR